MAVLRAVCRAKLSNFKRASCNKQAVRFFQNKITAGNEQMLATFNHGDEHVAVLTADFL